MPSLQVHPLHLGTITRQITSFCPVHKPEIVELPLIAWLIKGSNNLILVDTGGGDPSKMPSQVHPYQRQKEQTISHALQNYGFRYEDIDIVVITHLHWDHCSGLDHFPAAKIVVQSEELKSPQPFPPAIKDAYTFLDGVDFTEVSGDVEISEGVRAILTPGHTYGLQGVHVEGEKRSLFIASDTFPLFENIESDPPIMSNTYLDKKKYQTSINRIAELSAFVLPGHDFKVFAQEVYSC